MEKAEKTAEDYGLPVKMSEHVPIGGAFAAWDGAADGSFTVFAHPVDFAWITMYDGHNDAEVHGTVMAWIENKIEQMGAAAERRLDNMVREGERKQRLREWTYTRKENLRVIEAELAR